jgi:iron complex outermembrane recepter protein
MSKYVKLGVPRTAQRMGITAVSAALALAAFFGTAQAADESAASDEELTEVVVTGTAIRGAAPVGVNLITIGREQIEESGGQTLQQILKSVPAITGFGNAAQGGFQSFDGAGTFAPTIHGLGASASNGTLVLIDGHRLPLSGINHTLADPNVIAPLAIERVEVLPEGASSTYGSDAVAGVLNFITRRNFNGFEANAQTSSASGYNTYSAGFLWGETWDRGSALFTYNLSDQGNLLRGDRPFTLPDHRSDVGGNYMDGNCSPATVRVGPAATATWYNSPYSAAGANPTALNAGTCTYLGQTDLLPKNERHNVLAKLTRNINDNLEFSTDLVYSQMRTVTKINRGSISGATVFGPTNANVTQINPYYVNPTGVTGANSQSQAVFWSADDLFGPGAFQNATAQSFFVTSGLTLKFAKDWQASLGATAGVDDSSQKTIGALCTSCAFLALNGTAVASGSATAIPAPGSPPILNSQLVSGAIALDVWNPAGSNRTNAATRAYLLDSATAQFAHQSLHNYTLKLDGPVATLPGGELRLAVGAEYAAYLMNEELQAARGTGAVSTNSRSLSLRLDRDVTSGYLEVLVPIVGVENAIPFVRKLELDLSARTDKYSDFGNTTNPKAAFTWGVTDSLSFRGNVGKAFTAPALTSRGNELGITAESGFAGYNGQGTPGGIGNGFFIPISYVNATSLPAGSCNATTGLCAINTASVGGIVVTGGNKDLKAETGKTFSFGFDFAPQAVPGLRLSATYWSANYEDAITAPQAAFAVAAPGLNSILKVYPGGASQAQIDALTAGLPQTGALAPGPVYWSYSFQQRNAFSLEATGLDIDLGYNFVTGFGDFDTGLNISRKLKMDQKFGADGGTFSVLNSVGVNTTFPSNKMTARANVGWKRNNWNADLYANYTGGYVNWSGTANQNNTAWNISRALSATGAQLWPTGGGQPIGASTIFDLHVGYDFKGEGTFKGMKVYVDGSNIFDKEPQFYNASAGYDGFNASPIGRTMTVGVSKKW